MRTPRVYTPQALSPSANISLEEGASHHLLKVLRMAVGREVTLFNGEGNEYLATITQATKKVANLTLSEAQSISRESPLDTELAIAVSRGERFDWVIQKATELGVSRIIPLFSERTEVRLSAERLQKREQQWQKIIIAACEQCQRNRLPILAPAMNVENYCQYSNAETRLVLHHRSTTPLAAIATPRSVALLIGPEGGLSDPEITLAEAAGFQGLALGPRVLRTETAPLAALAILQAYWGDF